MPPPCASCAAVITTTASHKGFSSRDYNGKCNTCEPERLVVVVVVGVGVGVGVVVVVEWLYYSKRIIIVRWADLSDFFSLIFVGKMCVFVSCPMKIVTFLRKNDYLPKRVVDFPRERDTFRNKIMEIVEDFDEKSYNNNGKSWKSSRILRVNPFFHFSFFFHHFSSFF